MGLTEKSIIDQISVDEFNNVSVRRADLILRDGEIVSKTYHRNVVKQGEDLTGQDPRVVAVAQAAWNVQPQL
jgi:hypothetical protein